MSTEKIYTYRIKGFGNRFLEAFNNAPIADIARLTGKTYQGIKNYASGRIPEWKVMIEVSDSTGCSIHWLLTGEGEKYLTKNITGVTNQLAFGTANKENTTEDNLIPGTGFPTAKFFLKTIPLHAALTPEGIKTFRRSETFTVAVPNSVVRKDSVIFVIEGNDLESEGFYDGDLLIAIPATKDVDGKLVIAMYENKPILRELTQRGKWALFSALEGNSPVLRLPLGKVDIKYEITSMIHNFGK